MVDFASNLDLRVRKKQIFNMSLLVLVTLGLVLFSGLSMIFSYVALLCSPSSVWILVKIADTSGELHNTVLVERPFVNATYHLP